MVPIPSSKRNSTSRVLYILLSVATQYVPNFLRACGLLAVHDDDGSTHHFAKRELPQNERIVFGLLVPILVLLSGLFAGLTLGYMSLDETQLNVLSISGNEQQRKYANKIKPIRENGHLLLVTLLLCNMIVNESLPIVADPLLENPVESVAVSTTLIVLFAEIIPQSLFTRHGLYLGAKMAGVTRVLLWVAMPISWPVAKILEFVLGPHHGIIYRRGELKELIALHSDLGTHGGDLKTDTVNIVQHTLDLQEKVVRQAMTPIQDVFMLSIDSQLDYDLMKKICMTGHSRVPVYEEIEIPVHPQAAAASMGIGSTLSNVNAAPRTRKVKRIIGILLVKQCVLIDPKDAIPLRKLPLNKVLYVPQNEPLLGILDKFQEGRSHMAIVSRFSKEKAASVKKVVKQSLTQRLRQRVGIDSSDSSDEEDEEKPVSRHRRKIKDIEEATEDGEATLKEESVSADDGQSPSIGRRDSTRKTRRRSFQLPRVAGGMGSMSQLEQSMPADAVLAKEGAAEFLQGFDQAIDPLGLITLEDILEELIGEEIYDEFDAQGAHGDPYVPSQSQGQEKPITPMTTEAPPPLPATPKPTLKPLSLKGLNFLRSRSAPPSPRDATAKDTIPDALHELKVSNDTGERALIPRTYSSSDLEGMRPASPVMSGRNTEGMEMDVPVNRQRMTGRGPPSIIVEQHSSTSDPSPNDKPLQHVELKAPTPIVAPIPRVTIAQPTAKLSGDPSSRSASPAPSLEAILMDRKRRGGATGGPTVASNLLAPGNVTGPAGRPGAPKGTRFKSIPLVGERAGVIVAEQIRQNPALNNAGGVHTVAAQSELNEWTSREKEKEEPSKEW
ncbi:hypothetical protein VKT23_004368 [Stygiomarasmius scandens]|uniref:CNNM transmembrane domain-containing protein n=1 Tax=Marasmiellus scandens TaxID=2682957 RepID=A0ABR1JU11_9AGAR